MPNRMLRDWTGSEKIKNISANAERFFTRLIMKADDYGCFYANTSLLKANLFPLLLDAVREADISRWTAECQKAGLIVLYEAESKRYLQIVDFKQRLDKAKNKFPLPINPLTIVNDFPAEVEVEYEEEVISKSPSKWVEGGCEADKPPSPPKKGLEQKQQDMLLRQKQFGKSLVPFIDQYGKEMIREFFNYWSEPNKSLTKFKMEYETTWDLARRLVKWEENQQKFGNKGKVLPGSNGHEPSSGIGTRMKKLN